MTHGPSNTKSGQQPQRRRVRGVAIAAALLTGGILAPLAYLYGHLNLQYYTWVESPPLDAYSCVVGLAPVALVMLIALVRNGGPSNLWLAAVMALAVVIGLFIDAWRFLFWLVQPEHQVPHAPAFPIAAIPFAAFVAVLLAVAFLVSRYRWR